MKKIKTILIIFAILATITLGSMVVNKQSNNAIMIEMEQQGYTEIILAPVIISSCRLFPTSKTSYNHIFSYSAQRNGKEEKGEVVTINRLFYYEVKICDN